MSRFFLPFCPLNPSGVAPSQVSGGKQGAPLSGQWGHLHAAELGGPPWRSQGESPHDMRAKGSHDLLCGGLNHAIG